ncbi:MAG: hypothetical protein BGO78_05705 [Chloroflexi bacterium 44-23]|nr:MAG: hypothetical protein BGO78_05705 [Chloroflexi bacterium 44-23]
MDYTKILKRAWHILWHYPSLWVIGFILAFVGGGSSGGNPSGQTFYRFNQNDFRNGKGFPDGRNGNWQRIIERINTYMDTHFGNINESVILTWAIAAFVVIMLIVIVFTILKYVALAAHFRMVNNLEETGNKVSWSKGLKGGWSKAAFRLWLIDLVVIIPTTLTILVLFGCAAIPFLLGIGAGDAATAAGIIASIGIGMVVFLVIIIAVTVINLWLRFAHRICVLENKGVLESLKNAWFVLRHSLKDIALTWLILVGVRIAFGIVSIPIVLVLVGIAVAVVGGLGLGVYALGTQISAGLIILGVVLMILLLAIPITFVSGLGESFFESTWTLVYREIKLRTTLAAIPSESAV